MKTSTHQQPARPIPTNFATPPPRMNPYLTVQIAVDAALALRLENAEDEVAVLRAQLSAPTDSTKLNDKIVDSIDYNGLVEQIRFLNCHKTHDECVAILKQAFSPWTACAINHEVALMRLIEDQNRLCAERQEHALKNAETIADLRAELANWKTAGKNWKDRAEQAEADCAKRIDGLIATFKESNAHVEQAHVVGMRAMIERAEKAEKVRELYLARIKECIGISEVTSIARESLGFVNARLRHVLSLTNSK